MWQAAIHGLGFGGLAIISLLTDLWLSHKERTGWHMLLIDGVFVVSLIAWLVGWPS